MEYKQIQQIREIDPVKDQSTSKKSSICDEIEEFLGEQHEKTWHNAYYTEQMIALILPHQKIDMELSRRIEEAEHALPKAMHDYFKKQRAPTRRTRNSCCSI